MPELKKALLYHWCLELCILRPYSRLQMKSKNPIKLIQENRTKGELGIWSTILFASPNKITVIIIIKEKKRKPAGEVKERDIL